MKLFEVPGMEQVERGRGEVRDEERDELLVAGDVAELLRVTTAWVYAETRRGAVPHVRLGRYVRYRRGAILRWLEQREQQPAGMR